MDRTGYTGQPLERVEDAALLRGEGRFADDLGVAPGTLHAAILRSPHAHARIRAIDASAALQCPGVAAVLTGADVSEASDPFVAVVRQPMEYRALAVDRVRYVGEPVAVVMAADRYLAEDALEHIAVAYEPLAPVLDPEAAAAPDAPLLHDKMDGNVVSARDFVYGDPDAAFAGAAREVALTVRYPRNTCTPMEGIVVVAEYRPGEDAYDVLANFQGPYSLHAVMARALRVPETGLRLRTPTDSGGSFGVKQAAFPYVVLMCLAARKAGAPVKWVEDRLEHLMAANSATGRVTRIHAAVADDGEVMALRFDHLEDCGAYLRAPEPASLYRMHGLLSGAYGVRHVACANRVVLTNKTPSGLNRGFGGPQHYFALERLMQRIAVELDLDPLAVIARNLVPADAFPYRAPAGALLDSGDYQEVLTRGVAEADLDELRRRRDDARREGRLYGIGFAAVVEPSISNMGYITTVLTPEQRRKAGAKSGAIATATVRAGPTGAVAVTIASTPQGQGHRTVIAQVVADALGLAPEAVTVNAELDTLKDNWSIASGNYASRFAGAVAGASHRAAMTLRQRMARVAGPLLNCRAEELDFADGRVFARDNPDNAVAFQRVAGLVHWSPHALAEGETPGLSATEFWSPEQLAPPNEADEINGSCAYGFVFDICAVEIDPDTGQVRIDRYVTAHDAGRLLNPALADGQIYGGFAHGLGAALSESLEYGDDGSFLSGSFADYLVPTTREVPEPGIVHLETPSPFTPLGAKGVGEGNAMSTPVCIANAVADALGARDVALPLTPARVARLLHGEEDAARPSKGGRGLAGEGASDIAAPPEAVWAALMDPDVLAGLLPGCRALSETGAGVFEVDLRLGIGAVRGDYRATVTLSDLDAPRAFRFAGEAAGALGRASGAGRVELVSEGNRTRLVYRYDVEIGGTVAAVGSRMLDGTAKYLMRQFFARLARAVAPATEPWWRRWLRLLGVGR